MCVHYQDHHSPLPFHPRFFCGEKKSPAEAFFPHSPMRSSLSSLPSSFSPLCPALLSADGVFFSSSKLSSIRCINGGSASHKSSSLFMILLNDSSCRRWEGEEGGVRDVGGDPFPPYPSSSSPFFLLKGRERERERERRKNLRARLPPTTFGIIY